MERRLGSLPPPYQLVPQPKETSNPSWNNNVAFMSRSGPTTVTNPINMNSSKINDSSDLSTKDESSSKRTQKNTNKKAASPFIDPPRTTNPFKVSETWEMEKPGPIEHIGTCMNCGGQVVICENMGQVDPESVAAEGKIKVPCTVRRLDGRPARACCLAWAAGFGAIMDK